MILHTGIVGGRRLTLRDGPLDEGLGRQDALVHETDTWLTGGDAPGPDPAVHPTRSGVGLRVGDVVLDTEAEPGRPTQLCAIVADVDGHERLRPGRAVELWTAILDLATAHEARRIVSPPLGLASGALPVAESITALCEALEHRFGLRQGLAADLEIVTPPLVAGEAERVRDTVVQHRDAIGVPTREAICTSWAASESVRAQLVDALDRLAVDTPMSALRALATVENLVRPTGTLAGMTIEDFERTLGMRAASHARRGFAARNRIAHDADARPQDIAAVKRLTVTLLGHLAVLWAGGPPPPSPTPQLAVGRIESRSVAPEKPDRTRRTDELGSSTRGTTRQGAGSLAFSLTSPGPSVIPGRASLSYESLLVEGVRAARKALKVARSRAERADRGGSMDAPPTPPPNVDDAPGVGAPATADETHIVWHAQHERRGVDALRGLHELVLVELPDVERDALLAELRVQGRYRGSDEHILMECLARVENPVQLLQDRFTTYQLRRICTQRYEAPPDQATAQQLAERIA